MKALLIGNGVTSQIIYNYQNKNMLKALEEKLPKLYKEINNKFIMFLKRLYDNENSEIELINEYDKDFIKRFNKSFEMYGLNEEYEIFKKEVSKKGLYEISNVEAILKVAYLFDYNQEEKDILKKAFNDIWLNNDKNRIENADNKNINKEKFEKYLSQFNIIFTTNFDYLLESILPDKDILHLHGGFSYKKFNMGEKIFIRKRDDTPERKTCLIWGIDDEEKMEQIDMGLGNNMFLGVEFTTLNSVIHNYYELLKSKEFTEFHIWGFSGKNDKHITNNIDNNPYNFKIMRYISPKELALREEKVTSYADDIFKNKCVEYFNRDEIWNQIK